MTHYSAVTKTENGVRRHYVYDEDSNSLINDPFAKFAQAERAARLMNKELARQVKEESYGKVIAK